MEHGQPDNAWRDQIRALIHSDAPPLREASRTAAKPLERRAVRKAKRKAAKRARY